MAAERRSGMNGGGVGIHVEGGAGVSGGGTRLAHGDSGGVGGCYCCMEVGMSRRGECGGTRAMVFCEREQ